MKKRVVAAIILICMLVGMQISAADTRPVVKVPVVLYHVVDEAGESLAVSPELLREHMEIMYLNGYTPVSLQEMINYVEKGEELPEKPVCITFDDGYTDNYLNAFPILKEYEAKATIFVIGVSVGKDTYKNTEYKMNPHFDYEQAKEMIDSGLVSIQSHTYDMHQWAEFERTSEPRQHIWRFEGETLHEYLTAIDTDIKKSKNDLESNLGTEVYAFAYPTGRYNGLAEMMLRKNGIRVTMTTAVGPNYLKKYDTYSLHALNRYSIDGSISAQQLLDWLEEE